MGSTNKTAHYELPQFVANDKPSWLGDVNEAMEAIDTGIYGAKSSADGAQQTANNAVAGVASAGTRMDGIQTQLDTVATQANQTATTVAGHTSSIATNSANINTINSRLGSTDISGIGDGTVTGAIDALAEGGGGGSTGKTLRVTAQANTAYSAQLTVIEPVFNALTDDEKLGAFLYGSNGVVYHVVSTNGRFVVTYIDSQNKLTTDNLELSSHTFKENLAGTNTDHSSMVNANTLALYA